MTDNDDLNLAVAIQQQGREGLKPLYQELRQVYLQYMLRYTQDADIRLDSYHEAMITFYEYCLEGKYDPLLSSPKTLIFRMGRSYLINRLKLENRSTSQEKASIEAHVETRVLEQYQFKLNESDLLIRNAMQKLGARCQELLRLFYYHNYGIDAIMKQMEYKNENVVSSHKSRCLKQLKEILQEKA